jgi:hypothetical protein
MGVFSHTAGSTSKFKVKPVNFTFEHRGAPAVCV